MITFEGRKLFDLKAQHGLPLDFALSVIVDRGLVVEWPSFIRRARENGWYDFQTIKAISAAVVDAYMDRERAEQVITAAKLFMLKEPRC